MTVTLQRTQNDGAGAQSSPLGLSLSDRMRWVLFLFIAASGILALVDRQIISVLKPTIAAEMNWTDDDYGTLGAWFQGATAVALLVAGRLVDKFGVKWANPISVFSWSIVAVIHGWAFSLSQFVAARVGLGVTEAAVTPTQIKTIATIFPPHMRSTGVGLSNAIASMGAITAPFIIPFIAIPFGWRGAYVIAGILGVVWAAAWIFATRNVEFHDTGTVNAKTEQTGSSIFRERSTWAIAGAKALSDSTWWLMLFWMPDFLNRQFGLVGADIAPPLAIAYTGAAIGSIFSGTIASHFLQRGVSVNKVRKVAMFISATLVLPLPLALQADSPTMAALILAGVLAAHQGFSTNLFALITDVTDKPRIGRMTSLGVFSGNIGGMVTLKVAGLVLTAGLGYMPLFMFAAVSYLLALIWIHLWLPTIRQVEQDTANVMPASLH
ncbi:MAG: MFS transporter [Rhodospirillaceae bacterium]|nr:MFS transporter [Rhodospirillaceae bacterium]